ncbi:exostosin-like 3 [Octopus sinensis]|uniref:Exostosin-like 3 n=2 Tax=Octopus sinensis TaxID=2607531 RepID=A0A6P7TJB5_9MOLL|nr:exostosin-like 3 [Octopus sinensis]XP_029650149.1 exostosin-like 3 [Octopus sinensis]
MNSTRKYQFVIFILILISVLFIYITSPKLKTKLSKYYASLPSFARPQSNECNMETCFNSKRCNISNFKAFVYPSAVWNRTKDNSILGKTYLTKNPEDACMYIFFWKPGSKLTDLQFWQENGSNHIIINLDINRKGPLPPGHALVAQPRFQYFTFRVGFDFILPFYNNNNSKDTWEILLPLFPLRRKYWISYLSGSQPKLDIFRKYQPLSTSLFEYLKRHNSSLLPITVSSECSPSDIWSCPKKKRLQILTNSTFTIIVMPRQLFKENDWNVFQIHLVEILQSGSVPVLIGDKNYLPLQDYINWKRVLVTFHWNMLTKFLPFLSSLVDMDILQFKQYGRHVMEVIFSSKKSLLAVILESMHQRQRVPAPCFDPYHPKILFTYQPKSNGNQSYDQPGHFREGKHSLLDLRMPPEALSFINVERKPGKSWPPEKFTVVILTYRRQYILYKILNALHNLPFLDRVVIVWNDLFTPVNKTIIPELHVPVYVVACGKNSLNNRFLPFDIIRTDAIFSLDDDFTLPQKNILLAFRIWRENRDRLVGFPGRYHSWSQSEKKFLYKADYLVDGISLVLTSACFFHKHYTYLYTYMMHRAIYNYVEKNFNCEDIGINFLVAHVIRKPLFKVTKKRGFPCKYCGRKSISTSEGHKFKRKYCLNFFTKVYGYTPLIFTQFTIDN